MLKSTEIWCRFCVFCSYDYSGYGQSSGKVRDLDLAT